MLPLVQKALWESGRREEMAKLLSVGQIAEKCDDRYGEAYTHAIYTGCATVGAREGRISNFYAL